MRTRMKRSKVVSSNMWESVATDVLKVDLDDERLRSATRESRVHLVTLRLTKDLHEGRFKLPVLPGAAADALAMVNAQQASITPLKRTIEADPPLAGRVLAVANSARFGGQKVASLGLALQRLGTMAVRDVLYQAVAETHLFRGSNARNLHEKDHAIAVALLAREIVKVIPADRDLVFTCGLLHDIGRTLLLNMTAQIPNTVLDDEEKDLVIHDLHAAAGAKLAQSWQLPDLIAEACERHHTFYANAATGVPQSLIGSVIAAADRIAAHHGIGRPARPYNPEDEPFLLQLGLGDLLESLLASPPSNEEAA